MKREAWWVQNPVSSNVQVVTFSVSQYTPLDFCPLTRIFRDFRGEHYADYIVVGLQNTLKKGLLGNILTTKD